MTREEKKNILVDRLNKLNENGRNIKSTGVIRKLTRQIRNCGNPA